MRRLSMVVLAAVAALAGCTAEPTDSPPAPGTFSVAVREPAALLPAQVRDLPGRLVVDALWTPLTDPADAEAEPLAASEVTSDDLRTWTIRLREGLRFHDGSPVTALSYVDTWRAVVEEGWPGATVLTDVLRAEDFRAIDEHTVELVLDRPLGQVPVVLGAPALLPLPRAVLDSRDWAAFAVQPVGNGPYRLAGPWRSGEGARLTRVDDHAGPRPGHAREIDLRVVADPAEQYELARTGAVDLATQVPAAAHGRMRDDFGERVLMWPLPEVSMLGFPAANPSLADAAARHAVALAVDRATLEAGPLGHQVDLASALLPPAVPLGQRSGQCRPCNHDPEAATALWEQAGRPAGELVVHAGADQATWAAPLAEQVGATLGVPARIETGPPAPTGVHALTRTLHTRSPHELLAPLASDAPGNPVGYASTTFDQMLAAAGEAADLAESGRLYRLAENQLLRDLPVAPLWSAHGHAVWTDRIAGVTPSPSLALNLPTITTP
ncbi:oligopeptide transport system substrate-binding protein [Amycolatopsis arida]|uniref:Oligopeptide transport system substrate-binding protein n=1 Tax=Amycolatopsis arida TaxID=587909 RepID=A0A1I5LII6_9PSEU|nr:ABC transporter substrate-binding protein [Amycolatopsis arida]TDX93737.1 oligopeptide transport system substrate-binding protein [Amycolatopsis arida]SFO97194.1 oligopeptide transport system substrate-binding protein [Amycolatopsis arida]